MTTNKPSRKDKKHLIKDVKKDKKSRTKRSKKSKKSKKNNIIKRNSSSLSDLYTYESPVTNKNNSKIGTDLNVNVIYGLKDYLAMKK